MNKSFTFFTIFILFFFFSAQADNNPDNLKKTSIESSNINILPWIKNSGQYNNKIAFVTKTSVADIAILKNGNIDYFVNTGSSESFHFTEVLLRQNKEDIGITGKDISHTKFNFLKSNKNRDFTNISAFNTADYGEIYEGINLNINIRANNIEKVLKIAPGSNPDLIRFKIKDIKEMCENEEGELQLEIKNKIISFTKPIAWQVIKGEKVKIPVKYNIKGDFVYGFKVGKYNPQYMLYIDPLLSSSFIGGSQFDFAEKVVVGSNGNVYIGGITSSPDIPVIDGAYDETYNDTTDIFIAMFNSDLSDLEMCTYIGGSDLDILKDMKLDTADNVYFIGRTESKDYPVTSNAFDTIFNGSANTAYGDMIISCLNSKLTGLKYSTFVGGDRDDIAIAFDFDMENNLVVTGISETGILSVGPQSYSDTKDFVFFKMDNNLQKILASNSIQTDSLTVPVDLVTNFYMAQNVFITGTTADPSFPVTAGSFSDTLTGGTDVFIIKLSDDLSVLEASTFVGGRNQETPSDCFNFYGSIYVAGTTNSIDFPTKTFAYDTITNKFSGKEDAFVFMINNTLSDIYYSKYVGGSDIDIAGELYVYNEDIFLSGTTYSQDFPVFCNSYDNSYNSGADGFLIRLSPEFILLNSTYIGGTDNDFCYSIAPDLIGNIYTAGFTNSIDFPVYSGYDNYYNGDGADGFVLKMTWEMDKPYPCCSGILSPIPFSTNLPLDFKIEWEKARGATGYYFSAGTSQDSFDIVYHQDMHSTRNYILSGLSCGDTVYVKINPYNDYGINKNCETVWFITHEPFHQEDNISICEGDSIEWQGEIYKDSGVYVKNYFDIYDCDSIYTLVLDVNPDYYEFEEKDICDGETYFWQGQNYSNTGTYIKNYSTINGCDSIFELKLNVNPSYIFSDETSICKGDTFEWQNYTLTSGGTYSAQYETVNGCDSTYILDLTILPSYEFHDTASICEGDVFEWHGQGYSSPGNYQKKYTTINGCDSIYYLNLYLNANYNIVEEAIICSGDTMEWQGMTLDSSGTYYASYTTIAGCDSFYTLNLSFLPAYVFEEEAEICSGDTMEWQGMTLDSSGIYVVEYNTVEGCDSLYQLDLSVLPEYYFEEEATLCEGDTLEWQGINIDSSGIYIAEYETTAGCDSLYQIYVEEIIIDNTVTQQGDTLFAVTDSTATYQWVTCPDFDTIQGANEPVYITVESGEYAVIIEQNGCSKISECQTVVNSGIERLNKPEVTIFPNPVDKRFLTISIDDFAKVKTISLYNISGKKIKTIDKIGKLNKIDVEKLASGLYFIRINAKNTIINKKVIILTK